MAGFFGFFDYSRPGPGVPKDAPPKHRFIVFFEVFSRKFWKLVTLNMIYAIFCLPVIAAGIFSLLGLMNESRPLSLSEVATIMIIGYAVNIFTIGPATAGFTYVLRNFSREEHAWVWSDFKEHALKNYKQAFIISLIDLLAIIVGYINFQFYSQLGATNVFYAYLKYIVLAIGILYLMMHFYIYPLLVTFKLTVRQIVRNAFIFTMYKLPQNIGFLIICMGVFMAFFYYVYIGMILTPLLLLSTIGLIINFYVYPILKKNMIDKADGMEHVNEIGQKEKTEQEVSM
jgi:uncharacterized membrane protein YesL